MHLLWMTKRNRCALHIQWVIATLVFVGTLVGNSSIWDDTEWMSIKTTLDNGSL